MALTIQQPTNGTLRIQGAIVATPLPVGVAVAQPVAGQLRINGAVVIGQIVAGVFTKGLT